MTGITVLFPLKNNLLGSQIVNKNKSSSVTKVLQIPTIFVISVLTFSVFNFGNIIQNKLITPSWWLLRWNSFQGQIVVT